MVSMAFYKKKKPLTWRLLLLEIIKEYTYSACPTPPYPFHLSIPKKEQRTITVTQKVYLIQVTLKHSQGNRDTWKKSKYLLLLSYIASLQRGVRGLAGV